MPRARHAIDWCRSCAPAAPSIDRSARHVDGGLSRRRPDGIQLRPPFSLRCADDSARDARVGPHPGRDVEHDAGDQPMVLFILAGGIGRRARLRFLDQHEPGRGVRSLRQAEIVDERAARRQAPVVRVRPSRSDRARTAECRRRRATTPPAMRRDRPASSRLPAALPAARETSAARSAADPGSAPGMAGDVAWCSPASRKVALSVARYIQTPITITMLNRTTLPSSARAEGGRTSTRRTVSAGRHASVRRSIERAASVRKKMAVTASTTAPPVGTRKRVETPSPPAPARKATATLQIR